jgi:molybdenum cofactor cytidylyltransferase
MFRWRRLPRSHIVRDMPHSPTVIVLAAGLGSRFVGGDHKLTQPVGSSSVLGTTLVHAVASGLPVLVVTTDALAAEAACHLADRDILVFDNTLRSLNLSITKGIGASIAAGVEARSTAPGWLVLPGDMPLVQPSTLQQVAHALLDHPVAYAQYRGQRGHPVGFQAELYSELVALQGDEGTRRLVARYPAHAVDVDDAGIEVDVDTVADLQRVRTLWQQLSIGSPPTRV